MRVYDLDCPAPGEPVSCVKYVTQADLDAGIAKWQKILRLRDWIIRGRLLKDYDCSDWIGHCKPTHAERYAVLEINENYSGAFEELDHEAILVHEMLHIHTRPMVAAVDPENDKTVREEEQCINMLVSALLLLDRRAA